MYSSNRRRSGLRLMTAWPNLSLRCWLILKMCGASSSRNWAVITRSPSWCCSGAPPAPPVARGRRPWGRFTALPTRRYIDLGFYETLKTRLGAPGEFAQAYVIAHEVGHHVQNLLGISEKMDQMRGRVSQTQYNALSVRLELQADCLAGVWANQAQNARQILENGDVEAAMNAAAKIGDDALQRSQGGAVVPESFTHGSSAQRQKWFSTGLRSGSLKACDTFNAKVL